jgi:uncharacterized membrane protein
MKLLRRFAREERGGIAIIAAGAGMVMVSMAALAVDGGMVFLEARRMQGVADLAAIASARDMTHRDEAALSVITDNQKTSAMQVQVTAGVYDPNPAKAAADRFTAGGNPPNAARVEVRGEVRTVFAPIFTGQPTMSVTRRATAARAEFASFSIGTRLAALDGGIANALLSGLTGSTVSLTLLDYQSLANAQIDLFSYLDALKTTANLQAVSYDKVLTANITNSQALEALSKVLTTKGETRAASAILTLSKVAGNSPAKLDRLISLGAYGAQDHLGGANSAKVSVSAMDLANAVLLLNSAGRLVKLDLGASVPGIADTDLYLGIGDRPKSSPWLTVGENGGLSVRTAQARIFAKVSALSALGGLGIKPVSVGVFVEAASGEAKLSSINCPATTGNQSFGLLVKPSIGRIALADVDTSQLNDFTTDMPLKPLTLVSLPLILSATASAKTDLGGASWQTVNFSRADITAAAVKTVSTNDLVQASTASLVNNLNINVNLIGLNIGLGNSAITSGLSTTLKSIAPALDNTVNSLTDLLGVHLGQADVRAGGLRCRDAALVS